MRINWNYVKIKIARELKTDFELVFYSSQDLELIYVK